MNLLPFAVTAAFLLVTSPTMADPIPDSPGYGGVKLGMTKSQVRQAASKLPLPLRESTSDFDPGTGKWSRNPDLWSLGDAQPPKVSFLFRDGAVWIIRVELLGLTKEGVRKTVADMEKYPVLIKKEEQTTPNGIVAGNISVGTEQWEAVVDWSTDDAVTKRTLRLGIQISDARDPK